MRVLIVSNLDSASPFGQFLRPFHLGRGLAALGVHVVSVGVDCSEIEYGPAWSTRSKSLRAYIGAARHAIRLERPDVVYGHEVRGGVAALVAARPIPVVVDFHSLPSLEWAGYARTASGSQKGLHAAAAARSFTGERAMARGADGIVAAGRELGDDLVRLHRPSRPPVVVPNGVPDGMLDGRRPLTDPFAAGTAVAVAAVPGAQSEANLRALEFVRAVAYELDRLEAGIEIHVLGTSDGPPAPGLRYRGFLDDADYAASIAQARVCLLPYPSVAALAGGPRNKLLEYLACGRVIVTTREGLRGLPESAEWPGVVTTSDDPAAFAAGVQSAAGPGAELLDAARPRVREQLRWASLAERVRDVLEASAGKGLGVS